MTTLTPAPLKHGKKCRDGFYVEQEGADAYWLGHQHGETGDLHKVRISKQFYDVFVAESVANKAKYERIFKPIQNEL